MSESYHLADVWGGAEVSFGSMVKLQPNGVLFIRFKGDYNEADRGWFYGWYGGVRV